MHVYDVFDFGRCMCVFPGRHFRWFMSEKILNGFMLSLSKERSYKRTHPQTGNADDYCDNDRLG